MKKKVTTNFIFIFGINTTVLKGFPQANCPTSAVVPLGHFNSLMHQHFSYNQISTSSVSITCCDTEHHC